MHFLIFNKRCIPFLFNLWRVATTLLLPKREFNKPWGDTFRLLNITYPLKGAIPSDFAIEQTIVGIKGEPHHKRFAHNVVLRHEAPKA